MPGSIGVKSKIVSSNLKTIGDLPTVQITQKPIVNALSHLAQVLGNVMILLEFLLMSLLITKPILMTPSIQKTPSMPNISESCSTNAISTKMEVSASVKFGNAP